MVSAVSGMSGISGCGCGVFLLSADESVGALAAAGVALGFLDFFFVLFLGVGGVASVVAGVGAVVVGSGAGSFAVSVCGV